MFQTRKDMFFVCVTVGFAFLATKYRGNVLRSFNRLCCAFLGKNADDDETGAEETNRSTPIVADSLETCDYGIEILYSNLEYDNVLGFSCEWVNEGRVSLVQLATFEGHVVLFRLSKIGFVPARLKELLANEGLLKVGVAPYDDGQKLWRDYGCPVYGTLDLRMLADRLNVTNASGLAALCKYYLNVELNEEARRSDWDADSLSRKQIKYASSAALAAIWIYHRMWVIKENRMSVWNALLFYLKSVIFGSSAEKTHLLPIGVVDARFKAHRSNRINSFSTASSNGSNSSNNKSWNKNSIPCRNKPLYHNCYLEAPDGDPLCTCDLKKAKWYVSKGLGHVVVEEPYTVRLKFEPSGRAMGEVGRYYTQVKVNQCVVCGSTEKFIRKNVVPREYRKYFPLVMKEHQSHDVLLLCPQCHHISNASDVQLRRHLADLCNAPLSGPISHTHHAIACDWRGLRSAVEALRREKALPRRRQRELEALVSEWSGSHEITPLLLEQLDKSLKEGPPPSTPTPSSKQPHGIKVVEYFKNTEGGLVDLERKWREHFLTTMQPKHLPELWSVCHNRDRLCIRQSQNRIQPQDARVAGIPTTMEDQTTL